MRSRHRRLLSIAVCGAAVALVLDATAQPIPVNYVVRLASATSYDTRARDEDTVARTDPFGLVRAFVKVRAPDTIVVLPRRYPLPPRAMPGSLKYQQGGVALASSVGESEEFVSLREYRRASEFDPPNRQLAAKVTEIERRILAEGAGRALVRGIGDRGLSHDGAPAVAPTLFPR